MFHWRSGGVKRQNCRAGSASFGSSDVGILRGNYRPFAIALHEHLHHDAVARLPRGAIMLGGVAAYGLSVAAFASSTFFGLSIVLMAVTGVFQNFSSANDCLR